jgi:hypothetical protein
MPTGTLARLDGGLATIRQDNGAPDLVANAAELAAAPAIGDVYQYTPTTLNGGTLAAVRLVLIERAALAAMLHPSDPRRQARKAARQIRRERRKETAAERQERNRARRSPVPSPSRRRWRERQRAAAERGA